ncbi:hypothetical protein JCM33374_g2846 [Metschnikowia sp. JCM 33374]|nr:hypothetical protein JCM33374_g2846 [Metschnikowia sp. JCM 33374]
MRPSPRHLRRLYSIPEAVSNRDLFKNNQNLNFTHKNQKSVPTINDINVTTQAQKNVHSRYHSLLEDLCNNPELEDVLRVRTDRVQAFLGNKLPLEFPELLSVLCGLSNMNIKTSPLPAGSLFGDVFTQQDALRQLGSRFFEFHCSNSFVFSDVHYLSCTADELQQSIEMFCNKESLIIKLMNASELSECVIPYRGVHSAGLVRNRATGFRNKIKGKSCVASFYSMLGILVRKFGSETVVKEFWHPKMLHPTKGLLRVALSDKKS